MIDTFKESLISIDEAAKHVSTIGKKKRNRHIVMRWARRGVAGVKLATVLIGNEIHTSKEALNTFLNESRAAKLAEKGKATTEGIARAKEEENREAEELGI